MNAPALTRTLQWTARGLSLLSLGMLLLFMVGEGFNPFHMQPREAALSFCFPLGLMLGLALGWWRAMLGGTLGVASVLAFYLLHLAQTGRFPGGVFFALFSLPALVFLAAGFCGKYGRTCTPNP